MLSENISINATNIRRDAYGHGHNNLTGRCSLQGKQVEEGGTPARSWGNRTGAEQQKGAGVQIDKDGKGETAISGPRVIGAIVPVHY